jgi:hypothetical protein
MPISSRKWGMRLGRLQQADLKPDGELPMANLQTSKPNGKVLPDLAAMQARIEELEARNAALVASKNRALTLKVSKQGALSVYGLQRFPVTLYRQQWERLLGMAGDIKAFIEVHTSDLTTKD